MPSFLTLPPWMPWWAPLAVAVPALLYALVFLLMPFSVFGLKSRLGGIEARLDEIQGEIRSLSMRLPEPAREAIPREAPGPGRMVREEAYVPPPRPHVELGRPPIPPAPMPPAPVRAEPRPEAERRLSGRAEPRLNWPR